MLFTVTLSNCSLSTFSTCAGRYLFSADGLRWVGPRFGNMVCYTDFCVDNCQWCRLCVEHSASAGLVSEFRRFAVCDCQYGVRVIGLPGTDAGQPCDASGGESSCNYITSMIIPSFIPFRTEWLNGYCCSRLQVLCLLYPVDYSYSLEKLKCSHGTNRNRKPIVFRKEENNHEKIIRL